MSSMESIPKDVHLRVLFFRTPNVHAFLDSISRQISSNLKQFTPISSITTPFGVIPYHLPLLNLCAQSNLHMTYGLLSECVSRATIGTKCSILPRCKVEANLEVKLYVESEGMLALKAEICKVLSNSIVGSKNKDFYKIDALNAESELFISVGYYQGFHPREFEIWLNDQLSKNQHALPEFFVNGLSFSEEWNAVSISNEQVPFTVAKPAHVNPNIRAPADLDTAVTDAEEVDAELKASFNGEITFASSTTATEKGSKAGAIDNKVVGEFVEDTNTDTASIDSTSTTPFLLRDSELEGKLDLEGLLGQYMNISSKQAETLAGLGMQLITDLDDTTSIPNVSLPATNAEGTSLVSESNDAEAVRSRRNSAHDKVSANFAQSHSNNNEQKLGGDNSGNNVNDFTFSDNSNNHSTEEENYYDFDMDEFVKKYLLEESESTPVDAATWEVYGLFGTLKQQGALQAVAGAEGATLNSDVPSDTHGVLPVLNAIVKQKMEVEALNDHNPDLVEQMKAKLDRNISLQSPPESSSLYDPPSSKLMFNDLGLHDDTNLVEVDQKILESAVGVVTTENSTLTKTKKGTTVRNWICPSCKAVVFGRRTKCFKCKTFRTDTAPTSTILKKSECDDVREGDWVCTVCEGHNFANKLACFTCRAPRPPGFVIPKDTKKPFEKRPGDWTCPKCSENVFAKRNRCYRCGSGKAKK